MGGGQLGRMFCHAAQALGYRVCVLDPIADGPAGAVADRQIVAAYDDPQALAELGRACAAVTTEFENVPAASLERLAAAVPVRPDGAAVAVAQDRLREKSFIHACGVPVAAHAAIASADAIAAVDAALFPGILKTARLGYDGKGQAAVADRQELRAAWQAFGAIPCVLEQRLALRRELSVVIARGLDGATASFPVAENEHRAGILACSILPARIAPAQAQRARAIAATLAARLNYVGVLCVEFFELADGRLLVNEMAPRPHNSGHATIDACVSSQFEQQVRALAGLPLGDARQHSPAVMLNLLGDIWFDARGAARAPASTRCWPSAARACTCTARPRRGRAARWGT